jgi:Fe-S-cluster-containing hydrogenase component 2
MGVLTIKQYEKTGILTLNDLTLPSDEHLNKGVAIIECVQEIPCDPCVGICPVNAISMKNINAVPKIDYDKCTGCKRCVGICPGLAIFVIKLKDDKALITLPYEFLPIPKIGETATALDRVGKPRGKVKVVKVNKSNKTAVVTIEVDKDMIMKIRNIRMD